MSTTKYREDSKVVLIEVDTVHSQVNEVMLFKDDVTAKRYCALTYKVGNWNWSPMVNRLQCYIDETRRLEIRSVREVKEFYP